MSGPKARAAEVGVLGPRLERAVPPLPLRGPIDLGLYAEAPWQALGALLPGRPGPRRS